MSTIPELYNEKCHCAGCSQNDLGYSFVARRTAQRHNKRARLNAIRCERDMSTQRNMMEVDDEPILTHQPGALEESYTQTNSPVWEGASMSDTEDVSVTNDAISNGDNDDSGSNSNEISEDESEDDVIELDDNELNSEDPFATPDMPQNPVHRFIATFVVMFASRYVVDKGAVVLIEFINKLLTIYEQDFQLPLSLPGLQRMTGFSAMTKGIKKFVVCQDCHKVYEESASVPSHCDFVKLGARSSCNCQLTKTSASGALVAKRSYLYQSVLHRLGYLDLVRGTIIDPMHNLFLGTPKRLMDRWIKDEDIQDGDFAAMQKTAETMIVPGGYTSLNSKIGKQFSYMKADEWKSWVLVYSPVLLKDVLAKDRFENWINFVDACRLLIKPTITFDEVNTAHQFLQTFCTRCDELYNAEILTCNMHLHLHLRDTIRDFGPVYGYWLFGFERFNGLLKNLKTNRKIGFEETFMKKFIEDVHKDDLVNSFLQSTRQTSAFPLLTKLTSSFTPATIPSIRQRTFRIQSFVEASEDPNVLVKGNEPLPPSAFPLSLKSATTMSDIHYVHLLQYYKVAYNNEQLVHFQQASESPYFVDNTITLLKYINILGQVYKGKGESGSRGSLVQAKFIGSTGEHIIAYTGQIQYIFTHSFTPPPTSSSLTPLLRTHRRPTQLLHNSQHTFAFIKWYTPENDKSREYEHVETCFPTFSPDDFQCVLPVHRIMLEVATAEHTTRRKVKKMLVIPLPKKQYI
ncbi:hypothetical protein PHYBLDRAFT_166755 [Phycomyces blakesleeanus NRRL 1555(-)]|uniref:Transposase domain-containing protein n=1 Tax=Phycomyces blakesleeanus (strain ATCC 8743b / DSM 1359 / FGSC 10004 / NBRC 33097 / NRRL 1555) TaxID=763407 RepID=A0A162WH26_PHYB8|nr:hypothetical protein PHYBLDRAFT_174773 [Phycomyces blakesleeanus NRRL 1555(-)]XP_018293558.1 hypothetical protein PHYBLDRAFT_166755 [Phycomyces blakesleeanus NRRL 1555(-)]OAD67065.1 hypothetical protein PHYBLDRAFT_174773 [Phycomyces blakesleeanus NRRL 1555(-)]OAD75518.1 hypothetical protein PHYBLDRAFT_166755 [Phycomyces blakesleeanus NRRL 1555(-)]|eukprot:XP_018285105.1 hypothetical protein PHYBLDRAFT_174773 [Phycomyces blakesleeanus NRRL 1555(-)]